MQLLEAACEQRCKLPPLFRRVIESLGLCYPADGFYYQPIPKCRPCELRKGLYYINLWGDIGRKIRYSCMLHRDIIMHEEHKGIKKLPPLMGAIKGCIGHNGENRPIETVKVVTL